MMKTKIILEFRTPITGDTLRKIAVFVGNHIGIDIGQSVYAMDMCDLLYKRMVMLKPKKEYIYMLKGFCIAITESDVIINIVNGFNEIEATI